ncbi:MAG: hypothetical protein OJI67_19705, partial [Prosthecobacter sp.]|nr:hypothetical protein [Prosthecobacter sp.]
MIKPNTYAWTCPYSSLGIEPYYGIHHGNLYGKKVVTELNFRKLLNKFPDRPEIMIMGNFIMDRAAITSLCRENAINLAHSEDGFFPHYGVSHIDPLGFCWESSLPRMVFLRATDTDRKIATESRKQWLNRPNKQLLDGIKKPFVLWPMQLIGDKVNYWDLGNVEWCQLISHFRQCLPENFQLVIKEHPRAAAADVYGLNALASELKNTILVSRRTDLASLLRNCHAVGGANSTVLYEARLMYNKPVYAYARSWFTNHEELFLPVRRQMVRPLPRLDWLEQPSSMHSERLNDYSDWFLTQLLARQINRKSAITEPHIFRSKIWKLSYQSFLKYGEDIFVPDPGKKIYINFK